MNGIDVRALDARYRRLEQAMTRIALCASLDEAKAIAGEALRLAPASGGPVGDTRVAAGNIRIAVCPVCDIAGCRHLRGEA
ncbi:hypothetical protein [Frigidibacter oleivorans]|uniref:hypothetical protein n=1 Tax=Frigidibacter oleivorans TaxID=2487129 RepID=UPI000F8E4CD4|nr:hypothetical protein [Frigidibacter oleivorans]